MIRRTLLATTFIVAVPYAASAQGIPTYDNAQIVQRAMQFGQAFEQGRQALSIATSTRDQAAGIWRATTGGRPMDAIAQVLSAAGIHLPGLQSGDIGQALRGASQYGEAAQVIQRNLFAEPLGEDEDAAEMAMRRTGLANRYADALASVRAAEQRLRGINELRDQAGRTGDLQESLALQNRISAEEAALANDNDRTQRMLALHGTQDRIEAMRDREAGRQSSQRWADATRQVWDVRW